MPLFRKRPVVIEAERFHESDIPLPFQKEGICCYWRGRWFIRTLEGEMTLTNGDWVIRGVKGEFYPCKPDIFTATYEAIE